MRWTLGVLIVALALSLFVPVRRVIAISESSGTDEDYVSKRALTASQWVLLCGASPASTELSTRLTHGPEALQGQIGKSLGRLVRTGDSERDLTEVYARRGHEAEARQFMIEIARKHGYVLWFADQRTKFDPKGGQHSIRG